MRSLSAVWVVGLPAVTSATDNALPAPSAFMFDHGNYGFVQMQTAAYLRRQHEWPLRPAGTGWALVAPFAIYRPVASGEVATGAHGTVMIPDGNGAAVYVYASACRVG